jgi:hypothetical protein
MPVYGALFGVFSVRRKLKLADVRRLSQDIFALENELRNVGNANSSRAANANFLIPRLVNKYLWLIDYYASENKSSNQSIIDQTQLKIKLIAPDLFQRYLS